MSIKQRNHFHFYYLWVYAEGTPLSTLLVSDNGFPNMYDGLPMLKRKLIKMQAYVDILIECRDFYV